MVLLEVADFKAECIESSAKYGRFVAQPLDNGEGTTLGNALRRVLLSSLSGAAVTWIRIDGVLHEFSAMPSAKEDIMEVLLNVKALRLRPISGQPSKLFLEVTGEGVVTAADIQPSNDFEIANPELHLFTLDSPEASIRLELNVEIGKGYQTVDDWKRHRAEALPIGIIPVDSIFSPVHRVNFTVEQAHIGQESGYERLILEVWTDGTVSPEEAVVKSAESLINRLSAFRSLGSGALKAPEAKTLRSSLSPEQADMPVEKLEFSTRTINCLRRGGIKTLGELLSHSEEELMALRHFGERSRREVVEKLQSQGYVLPIKEPKLVAEKEPQEAPVLAQGEEADEA